MRTRYNTKTISLRLYIAAMPYLSGLIIVLALVACQNRSEEATPPTTLTQETQILNLDDSMSWTDAELAVIRSLWLETLPSLPPNPSNGVADDPRAAAFGHQLFFDSRLSGNGQFSCATCHQPDLMFTDGLPLAKAAGTTLRSTPTIVGLGHSGWFYWDGRRDSLWSQALTPLEALAEQAGTRTQFVHLMAEDDDYRQSYEALFGPLPDFSDPTRFPRKASPDGDEEAQDAWFAMALDDRDLVNQVFANIGKAIAAYERLILPGSTRFDGFAEAILRGDQATAEAQLTKDEIAGLRLFIGPAQCTQCHNGPLFTNGGFHNINVPTGNGLPLDYGRIQGVQQVFENLFNCLGPYSDAQPDQCLELKFVKTAGEELPGAFKVPTLRNVAETAPYMHAGQFETLAEVLNHYNQAIPGPLGHNELTPLNLSQQEMAQIEAFLRALSAPLAMPPEYLAPPN
ncbi:MAG: cytochrome c peroxidase [Chloroflexota bacterium]